MKTQKYLINGFEYSIWDDAFSKMVRSKVYNYNFNKTSGRFARWGITQEDDPDFAPAPEILDIEVTTICDGGCPFCYKGNTTDGQNMSLDTFKKIIDVMPIFITQIALGADSKCISNPDIFKMMEYARSKGIVPNITVANISDDTADKLAKVAGAVAVSRYANKDLCYDSVQKLTDRGMKQTNMHFMISEQTFEDCKETLNDILADKRLKKLNAIVLLSLKKKGRGEKYTPLSEDKFKYLVDFCLEHSINFGMDSCSASKFLNAVKGHKYYREFLMRSEPCESGCFSSYVNVDGKFYPCSFTEGSCGSYGNWQDGIDLTKDGFDFFKDLWFSDKVVQWRSNLLGNKDKCSGCRKCPAFDV